MGGMDRRPLKTRSQAWAPALAKALVKAGLTPNGVSIIGIGGAVGAGWLLACHSQNGWALLGAAMGIQFRLLCNMIDGLMAVEGGAKTKDGVFFNEAPDRLEDVLILVGAGYGAGLPWLGWLAAVLAVTTAYLRAFGASLGLGQDFCGPGAKPHRMFVLTLGCLAGAGWVFFDGPQRAVAWALIAAVVLTGITVLRRGWRVRRNLLDAP